MSYKQQQKADKKYFDDLNEEYTKDQLIRILIKTRKDKNKYLLERDRYKRIAHINQSSVNDLIQQIDVSESQRLFLAEHVEDSNKKELRLLTSHIIEMPKVYRKRHQNWIIVQSFLQYYTSKQGSASSKQKCIDLGIDPYGYTLDQTGAK